MPSDDGVIKLAGSALTDHPYKEPFALWAQKTHSPSWAGSTSASIFFTDATGATAYSMSKCHATCAHPTVLICCPLKGVDICSDWLVMFSAIVCVCLPSFYSFRFRFLIKVLSKAFLGCLMTAHPKQGDPGYTKLPCKYAVLPLGIEWQKVFSVQIWFFQSGD